MGQLLTLMVFGDVVASGADNTQQQRRQSQQSTAGNSSSCTQYRTARHDDDDIDSEEDEGRSSAHYTRSTDLGSNDPEMGCRGGTGTTDEHHQDEESDADGAGHCSGELRCDPSTLESWTCTVHQHRTGLIGNGRACTGSSGRGSGPDDDDGDRFQLMQIMCISDKKARLRALQHYLMEADAATGSTANDTLPPDDRTDPRLATSGAQRGAADYERGAMSTSSTSGQSQQGIAANFDRGRTVSDDFPRCAAITSGAQRGAPATQRGPTVDYQSRRWPTYVAHQRGAADRECLFPGRYASLVLRPGTTRQRSTAAFNSEAEAGRNDHQ